MKFIVEVNRTANTITNNKAGTRIIIYMFLYSYP